MGAVVTRFCKAVTRKKTVNAPTPGLQKRLSLVDLAAVGVSSVVGVGGYVCVGAGAAEWAGPSIILSVLLTSFSTILTGFVCAELHVRIPKGCGVYAHVYTTLGELPAVLVASSLLLDLLLLPAFAARSSSQYMESSINRSLSDLTLHPRLTFIHDSRYISPDYDLAALALVTLCTLMVVAGTKVICQIGGIAVGVSLLVLSAISCTAFVRADLKHWTQHQGFFPHGLQGVMNGGAIMSIGVIGSQTSSFLMDECQHSKDTLSRLGMAIGIVFLLALFPSAVAFTLASPSFETAAPLGNLFPGASLMAMRALVGVGGILGLWATVLSSLFGASRLLHRLSCDGLAPRWLRVISPHTATPWVSILICGILSGTTAAICSSWLLLRTLGTGSLGAGVAGATAVLSRRYRPLPVHHSVETTHTNPAPSVTSTRSDSPKEMTNLTSSHQRPYQAFDDTQPRQLSVEWESGNWVTAVVEPPQLPSWNSWTTSRFLVATFIINCLAGVGVIRGAKELQIGNWVWAGVALCACGCLVCSFGLWLQPKNPLPEPSQRDLVPAFPLVAIFTNILLMLNLPAPALLFSCGVWAVGCLVWVVQGRTGSLEAVLSRALLTQNDGEATPEML